MDVSKCSDYPILFQPYTLRISISNVEEHAMLASIFMNSEVIAKALTYQGYNQYDELVTFINHIGHHLEENE
jgi:hypothetical protein